MFKALTENPIFFRETRVLSMTKGIQFQKIINAVIYPLIYLVPPGVLVFMCCIDGRSCKFDVLDIVKGCFYFSVGVQFFYILIASLSGTQCAFTREKEQKTYESLISTMMTPGEIFAGKYWASMYPAVLSLAGYGPLFIVYGLISGCRFSGLLAILFFSLVLALFSGCAGLYASLFSSNSKKAQSLTAGIFAALILGTAALDIFGYLFVHSFFFSWNYVPIFSALNIGGGYIFAMMMLPCKGFQGDHYLFYYWLVNIIFMALLAYVFYTRSLKRLSQPPGE